jgi:hypothetical protein
MPSAAHRPRPRILHGEQEPIFDLLPNGVLANLRQPASENALLWNLIYPLIGPGLDLGRLLALPPLWGSAAVDRPAQPLKPYFWGYSVEGERFPRLDEILAQLDGPGGHTEIDLMLRGERSLVVAEAKNLGHLGRCKRYAAGRCPEVHSPDEDRRERIEGDGGEASGCRYWMPGEHAFARWLDFGLPPAPGQETAPPCDRHYQLARGLLVGQALARRLGLELHFWLLIPRRRWPGVQRQWLDFARRVREDSLWRRMRVLDMESLRAMASCGPRTAGPVG